MTDHDALAALPLTPEEIAHLRKVVARELRGEDNGAWATSVIARLLATLDAAPEAVCCVLPPDHERGHLAGYQQTTTPYDDAWLVGRTATRFVPDWARQPAPAPDDADPRPIVGVDPSDGYHECDGDPCRTCEVLDGALPGKACPCGWPGCRGEAQP